VKCIGHPVRAQQNSSGSCVRETAQRTLQQGHLRGGAGTASARALRVVSRCRRCVTFWLACVVLRSSVVRARRLRVRSGLVVIATRLGCIMSPWSVRDGDDVLAEGILSSVVRVSVACSSVWAGLLDS
jgi:hypothetical protein